ncbi:alpha/beta hydrolase [Magnetovibrio sp.]|uniref:RBBP9/YdeN family alpha/beta hydrolase n=1 Tax=Magnetovibrio sp. TaxID=2024836 RepID=UPI002F94A1B2
MMGHKFFDFKQLNIVSARSKPMPSEPTVLLVPGLGGSGPNHWQSRWEQTRQGCSFVRQNNWNIPDRQDWLSGLDRAVRACATPPILVAHSLGCALVAHWAALHPTTPVQAALLVAPADVDSDQHTPAEVRDFAPMPMARLPFPTSVIASTTDTYVDTHRAQVFATAWGADFINIGACGHINADSRLGDWDKGWDVLEDLIAAEDALSLA